MFVFLTNWEGLKERKGRIDSRKFSKYTQFVKMGIRFRICRNDQRKLAIVAWTGYAISFKRIEGETCSTIFIDKINLINIFTRHLFYYNLHVRELCSQEYLINNNHFCIYLQNIQLIIIRKNKNQYYIYICMNHCFIMLSHNIRYIIFLYSSKTIAIYRIISQGCVLTDITSLIDLVSYIPRELTALRRE